MPHHRLKPPLPLLSLKDTPTVPLRTPLPPPYPAQHCLTHAISPVPSHPHHLECVDAPGMHMAMESHISYPFVFPFCQLLCIDIFMFCQFRIFCISPSRFVAFSHGLSHRITPFVMSSITYLPFLCFPLLRTYCTNLIQSSTFLTPYNYDFFSSAST